MFSAGGSSVESGTEITFQVASLVSWLNIDGLFLSSFIKFNSNLKQNWIKKNILLE